MAKITIEQMLSLYESTVDIFMRPYDVDFTIGMDYKDTRSIGILENDYDNYADGILDKADVTEKWMKAYQLKTYGNSLALCILQTRDDTVKLNDLVVNWNGVYDNTTVDADWVNLQDSASPSKYSMIDSVSDLYPIYNAVTYTNTNNIYEFLTEQTYLDGTSIFPNLPKVDTSITEDIDGNMIPMYYRLPKTTECDLFESGVEGEVDCVVYGLDTTHIIHPNSDQSLDFINISWDLKSDSPGKNVVELDLEDDIYDSGQNHTEAFVVLSAETTNITPSVYTESVDGGTVISERRSDGTQYTGRAVLSASTPMLLKIKPDEGKTIDYVSMHLKNSGKRVDLLSGNDTVTASSEIPKTDIEVINNLYVDEEGYYVIQYSVPYQDAYLEVGFRDLANEEITYTVELDQTAASVLDIDGTALDKTEFANLQIGDVQFTSNNGITKNEAFAGEKVTVLVRPYTGYVATGIVVTDADGNTIEVNEADATSYNVSPTTKAYTFKMPSSDVTVEACYQEGHTVTIVQPDNGNAYFNGTLAEKSDWYIYPVTFAPGEVVQVDVKADSNCYFETCDVVGSDSNEMPLDCSASYVRTEKDSYGNSYEISSVVFTAGNTSVAEDYVVAPVCQKKTSGNYTVTLESTIGEALVYFLTPVLNADGTQKTDADGKLMFDKVLAHELGYSSGDDVYVAIEKEDAYVDITGVSVTAGSSAVEPSELAVSDVTIDEGVISTDNVDTVLKFTMASGSNMTVQVSSCDRKDKVHKVSYTFTESLGHRIELIGLREDDGEGCGYAVEGDSLCLRVWDRGVIGYMSGYSIVDADGNEVPCTTTKLNGNYYYDFTMPAGDITVYAYSKKVNVIITDPEEDINLPDIDLPDKENATSPATGETMPSGFAIALIAGVGVVVFGAQTVRRRKQHL